MDYEFLEIERTGHVATLWLNRPERMNALSRQVMSEIEAAARSFLDDEETRVVIFAGRGKHFSAGADLQERGSPEEAAPSLVMRRRQAGLCRACRLPRQSLDRIARHQAERGGGTVPPAGDRDVAAARPAGGRGGLGAAVVEAFGLFSAPCHPRRPGGRGGRRAAVQCRYLVHPPIAVGFSDLENPLGVTIRPGRGCRKRAKGPGLPHRGKTLSLAVMPSGGTSRMRTSSAKGTKIGLFRVSGGSPRELRSGRGGR